jgi:hypothetical protein
MLSSNGLQTLPNSLYFVLQEVERARGRAFITEKRVAWTRQIHIVLGTGPTTEYSQRSSLPHWSNLTQTAISWTSEKMLIYQVSRAWIRWLDGQCVHQRLFTGYTLAEKSSTFLSSRCRADGQETHCILATTNRQQTPYSMFFPCL